MDALMKPAFAACTADVTTWDEVMDLSEEENSCATDYLRGRPGFYGS